MMCCRALQPRFRSGRLKTGRWVTNIGFRFVTTAMSPFYSQDCTWFMPRYRTQIVPCITILISLISFSFQYEYKLLSLTHEVLTTIFITSSLFNVVAILTFHPSLLLLGHRHPLWKQLIASFVMLHLVCGINFRLSCSSDSKTTLPKYTTTHLAPPTLLEISALSLTNMLHSQTKLHVSPKPVTITFVNFAVSGLTSIRQLPVPLRPLSLIPNLITVILFTTCIHSPSLKYPVYSRSRTLLLALSLKLLSPVTSLPPYAPSYKVLTTTQPPYLYDLISVQRHRSTRSLSFVTLARPPSSSCLKVTDRSFRHASPCLRNQLPLSLCQPHSGTSSSISDSPIPSSSSFDSPLCSSITRVSFTSGLKPTCFTNPFPVVSLPPGLPSRLYRVLPRPFLLSY